MAVHRLLTSVRACCSNGRVDESSLFLKASLGMAGWLAASPYSFGKNLRKIKKFSVTLPGLGPNSANEIGNYLPVLSPDTTSFLGIDYYDVVASQFAQTLHPSIGESRFWGYADAKHLNGRYLGSVIVAEEWSAGEAEDVKPPGVVASASHGPDVD